MSESELDSYRACASTPIEISPTYSVVIPCYNEELRIVPTIGAIATHMSTLEYVDLADLRAHAITG